MNVSEIKQKYQSDAFGIKVPVEAQKKSYLKRLNDRRSKVNELKKSLDAIYREMESATDLAKCRELEIKSSELLRGV